MNCITTIHHANNAPTQLSQEHIEKLQRGQGELEVICLDALPRGYKVTRRLHRNRSTERSIIAGLLSNRRYATVGGKARLVEFVKAS